MVRAIISTRVDLFPYRSKVPSSRRDYGFDWVVVQYGSIYDDGSLALSTVPIHNPLENTF